MTNELPRKINSIDEFESLPTVAVLVDNTNHAWVKGSSQWWSSHPYDDKHQNSPMKMKWTALVFLPGMIAD